MRGMTIAFPVLAVAFAAFCVWLTVRVVNRKERWAKWTLAAMIVSLPLLYILGFGPACWWSLGAKPHSRGLVSRFYWPIGWVVANGPEPCQRAARWYALLAIDGVDLPTDSKGSFIPVFRGPGN